MHAHTNTQTMCSFTATMIAQTLLSVTV